LRKIIDGGVECRYAAGEVKTKGFDMSKGLTEKDLTRVGVGKYIPSRMPGYDEKKAFYQQEKVWGEYCQRRQVYRTMMTHPQTGYVDNDGAAKMAQVEIDAILFRRVRNEEVPAAVVSDKSDEMLKPAEEFVKVEESKPAEKSKSVDNLEIVRWIYDHIGIKDVKPSDAPNPGAYQHLITIQSDKTGDSLTDFYKTIWPRTFTKDDGKESKYNDDGRTVIELIRRLQKQNAGAAAV
jgi:hypothetical protein